MPKLLYQGHGSFRLVTDEGYVIFIDPYAGEGYDLDADLILVTHQHFDHNQIDMVPKKADAQIISNVEALAGGKHNSFDVRGIKVEAVEASNKGHSADDCVGYIVSLDQVSLYFCGDTSITQQMADLSNRDIDYAFFCCDGEYNMDLEEAAEAAKLVGAKNNVPVHLKPGELFDRDLAEAFKAPNRLIIEAGQEIKLDDERPE
ncbi:MAG: MBL fold metallo-hydrolase [Symbiobacteriaceae bacterium]|nr:MBL fold metallo-hydrolase [Symbiobacteriaceae bacterium]